MTAGLSSTGVEVKALSDIQDEISDAIRSGPGMANLDLSEVAALGQKVGAVSSQLRQLWELGQAVHASFDVDQASGVTLRARGALTGCAPLLAAPSRVTCTVNLNVGTYHAGDLVAFVDGAPNSRFELEADYTQASTGNVDLVFRSVELGPISALAGTLTQMQAVSGWNSVTNALDASLGRLDEKDSAYRLRREQELARRGSTTVDAIRADLLEVEGVSDARVIENTADTVDGFGTPSRGVQAFVKGGLDADIAKVLWNSKGAGIPTGGTTSVTVTDSQGEPHTVKFTRAAEVDIYITVHLTAFRNTYAGDAAVQAALNAQFNQNTPGKDAIYSRAITIVGGITGVDDVTDLRLGTSASPTGQANIVINSDQYADSDLSKIVVISTLIDGDP